MGIDESKDFIPVRIAVLTVSDTRTLAEDRSGDTLVERLRRRATILPPATSCLTTAPASRPACVAGSPTRGWT